MEEEKFVIGDFTFDTFHEYRDAQEDLKKIECINRELDVHDPEIALRLYNKIRNGEIVFKSPIGEQYFNHIADIVADKSVDLLEDKAVVDEAEGQAKHQRVLAIAILCVAVAFFGWFSYSEISSYLSARKLASLQDQVTETQGDSADTASETDENDSAEASQAVAGEDDYGSAGGSSGLEIPKHTETVDVADLTLLPDYENLVENYPDLVGWLTIDGTNIDYPVVQKSEDNTYYLTHAFDGQEDKNGTLFVDCRSDIVNPTTNTIIYGHNMKSGLMFGQLKYYLTEDFYEEHRDITFNTIYEYRTYEIQLVGLSQVNYQDETEYRYYDFIQADSVNDLAAFLSNVNSHAVYGSTENIGLGDEILTLSTCNSYKEDGRLFIVAKRIK